MDQSKPTNSSDIIDKCCDEVFRAFLPNISNPQKYTPCPYENKVSESVA